MSKSSSPDPRSRVTRAEIIAEARDWIGTPYHPQQSRKRAGCDCKGLIVGVARELGLAEADTLAARTWNYRLDFSPERLLEGLAETLRRVEQGLPGDVMAIEVDRPGFGPRHLAIMAENDRLIHCYGKGPLRQVIQVPIGRSRRIHSYWTWPSLGAE